MAENVIVGAGLSGLVAAINLAREGRDVIVLEREARIGGSPLYNPSPQGTPVDAKALETYTGIDISPVLSPFAGKTVVYGDEIDTDVDSISAKLLERGPRSSSLDSYLYEIARSCGVKFEFKHPFYSQDDIAELPPDTIIATGLYFEGFDSTRVPYLVSFHYVARKTIGGVKAEEAHSTTEKGEWKETDEEVENPQATERGITSGEHKTSEGDVPAHVTIYHDYFTSDYAYTTSINGIVFAHLFQRKPIGKDSLYAFQEAIYKHEGLEFENWTHFTFPVPAAKISNPKIFAGDKILAGSLSGCIEPYMFFGIHGALVSGKIAAMAVFDRALALREFELATSSYRGAFALKKIENLLPHAIKKYSLSFAFSRVIKIEKIARAVLRSIPGWKNCEKNLSSNMQENFNP